MLIVCPGIHDPSLTEDFLAALSPSCPSLNQALIFPTQKYAAYSSLDVVQFLSQNIHPLAEPVMFVSFSAGVVGAMGAAWSWQLLGGKIKGLIAADGWGVPRMGNFPLYRISHDYFTHWSAALLGSGTESFYADPAVPHLDLWRYPHLAKGWQICQGKGGGEYRVAATAGTFIASLLNCVEYHLNSGEVSP